MDDLILSQDQLAQIIPSNKFVHEWYEVMTQLLPSYEINSPLRLAGFLSQCAHESSEFNLIKENLNYKAATLIKVWPRHFPNMEIATQYAHNAQAIANNVYANRLGNGSENSGDGYRFCGRGLIQITGRSNYQSLADSLKMNIDDMPEYLATFEGALQSACWFWKTRNINSAADAGNVEKMTKLINGGIIGIADLSLIHI